MIIFLKSFGARQIIVCIACIARITGILHHWWWKSRASLQAVRPIGSVELSRVKYFQVELSRVK